jgi:hypothetical protein
MRLARGATKQQAIDELCKKLFAPRGLESVPPIREWWDEETRRTVTNLQGWKARKALGLL